MKAVGERACSTPKAPAYSGRCDLARGAEHLALQPQRFETSTAARSPGRPARTQTWARGQPEQVAPVPGVRPEASNGVVKAEGSNRPRMTAAAEISACHGTTWRRLIHHHMRQLPNRIRCQLQVNAPAAFRHPRGTQLCRHCRYRIWAGPVNSDCRPELAPLPVGTSQPAPTPGDLRRSA